MTLNIVDAVKRKFEEKNEGKDLPDMYKNKAREMERALETFSTAARHLFEIGGIDLSDVKEVIKKEIEGMLR